jgi:hypothetical protein
MNPETNVYGDLTAMYGAEFTRMMREAVGEYVVTATQVDPFEGECEEYDDNALERLGVK